MLQRAVLKLHFEKAPARLFHRLLDGNWNLAGLAVATALLMLPAFVLIVAVYVPGNRIKAAIGHPMLAGAKVWAIAHLIANGRLADVVLFGTFLVWAVIAFSSSRRRDRAAGVTYPAAKVHRDIIVVVVSLALWIAFATFLHVALIGVKPFAQ